MKSLRISIFTAIVFLGGVAFGQKPAAPTPTAATASTDDSDACNNSVDTSTGFTGCQLLLLHDLMSQLATAKTSYDATVQPISVKADTFIQKVVAKHPGMKYESPTAQFSLGRLVPNTPPPAPQQPGRQQMPPPQGATPPATATPQPPAPKQ